MKEKLQCHQAYLSDAIFRERVEEKEEVNV